jgi:hypothetical protein
MKKSHFSDQPTAFALQQAETGTTVADVCRKLGSQVQCSIVGRAGKAA